MAATAAKMGKQNPKMSAAEKADVRQATKDRKAKKALQKAAKADIRRTASSKAARLSKSALAELGASPSKVKDKESRVKGHCLFAEVNESLQTFADYRDMGSSACDNSFMFKVLTVFETYANPMDVCSMGLMEALNQCKADIADIDGWSESKCPSLIKLSRVITRFIQKRASSKRTQVLIKLRAHPSFTIVSDAFTEQGYDEFDSEVWDLVYQIAIADAFEAVVPPAGGDERDPMDIIDDLISRLVPAGLVAPLKSGLKRLDEDVLGIIFVPIIAQVLDSDAVDDGHDGSDDDADDGLDFTNMEKIDFAGQPDLLQRYLFLVIGAGPNRRPTEADIQAVTKTLAESVNQILKSVSETCCINTSVAALAELVYEVLANSFPAADFSSFEFVKRLTGETDSSFIERFFKRNKDEVLKLTTSTERIKGGGRIVFNVVAPVRDFSDMTSLHASQADISSEMVYLKRVQFDLSNLNFRNMLDSIPNSGGNVDWKTAGLYEKVCEHEDMLYYILKPGSLSSAERSTIPGAGMVATVVTHAQRRVTLYARSLDITSHEQVAVILQMATFKVAYSKVTSKGTNSEFKSGVSCPTVDRIFSLLGWEKDGTPRRPVAGCYADFEKVMSLVQKLMYVIMPAQEKKETAIAITWCMKRWTSNMTSAGVSLPVALQSFFEKFFLFNLLTFCESVEYFLTDTARQSTMPDWRSFWAVGFGSHSETNALEISEDGIGAAVLYEKYKDSKRRWEDHESVQSDPYAKTSTPGVSPSITKKLYYSTAQVDELGPRAKYGMIGVRFEGGHGNACFYENVEHSAKRKNRETSKLPRDNTDGNLDDAIDGPPAKTKRAASKGQASGTYVSQMTSSEAIAVADALGTPLEDLCHPNLDQVVLQGKAGVHCNGGPGCKKVHICNFHSASGKSSGLIEGKMGAEKTLFLSQKGKVYAAVSAAPKSVKAAGAKAADDITADDMKTWYPFPGSYDAKVPKKGNNAKGLGKKKKK